MATSRSFTVRVPASSGNMGPGFDVLGIAVSLYSEVRVRVLSRKPGNPVILIKGEGERKVPSNERNLVFRCIRYVFKKAKKPLPQLRVECINRIPLARGLGSSSAAILAGLLAGNRLLGNKFSLEQILDWATAWEGHPDNVAAALYGGIQASLVLKGRVESLAWPVPNLKLVAAVPAFKLSTERARHVLPKTIPMKDVVSNLAAVAVMAQAFAKRKFELLSMALNDRVHEPYRAALIPGFWAVKKAALDAGAYAVTLSGAGPSLMAYASSSDASRVAQAMQRAFKRAGVESRTLQLSVDKKGAVVR